MNRTERSIVEFLLQLPTARGIHALAPDDPLLNRRLLDSLGVVKTLVFCEEKFGIEIPDEEVIPENFESVRALAQLIGRLQLRG